LLKNKERIEPTQTDRLPKISSLVKTANNQTSQKKSAANVMKPTSKSNEYPSNIMSVLGLSDDESMSDGQVSAQCEEIIWCFSKPLVERKNKLDMKFKVAKAQIITTTVELNFDKAVTRKLKEPQTTHQKQSTKRRKVSQQMTREKDLTRKSSYEINHFSYRDDIINTLGSNWTKSLNFDVVKLPPLIMAAKLISKPKTASATGAVEDKLVRKRGAKDELSSIRTVTDSIQSGTVTARSEDKMSKMNLPHVKSAKNLESSVNAWLDEDVAHNAGLFFETSTPVFETVTSSKTRPGLQWSKFSNFKKSVFNEQKFSTALQFPTNTI
jgi:hypothetical protein